MSRLVELAARAEGQPSLPGSGSYSFVHTRGWYLATAQMTDGRVLGSRVEETEREFWVAGDGSGRIEETRDGTRSPTSGVYGPGSLWPGPLAAADVPVHVVVRQSGSSITGIADLWSAQAVPPALQAVLLRTLSGESGVRLEDTTDRLGRPGLAVSVEGHAGARGTCRPVLVLDLTSGMLLASWESPLVAGGPIHPSGASSYTCWVRTGYAPDTDSRP